MKQFGPHLLPRLLNGFAVHFRAAGTERGLDVSNYRRNLRVRIGTCEGGHINVSVGGPIIDTVKRYPSGVQAGRVVHARVTLKISSVGCCRSARAVASHARTFVDASPLRLTCESLEAVRLCTCALLRILNDTPLRRKRLETTDHGDDIWVGHLAPTG